MWEKIAENILLYTSKLAEDCNSCIEQELVFVSRGGRRRYKNPKDKIIQTQKAERT